MDRISLVTQKLEEKFPQADINVFDLAEGQDYLGIQVASSQFENMGLLEQHRMVMDEIKGILKEDLHAVQIKTRIKKGDASHE